MSEKTKAAMMKAVPNRWFTFCILTLSGGIAFKLGSMKDMFYVPMQEFMGLTNTQIGGALSAYGIVQTLSLIHIYLRLWHSCVLFQANVCQFCNIDEK